MASRNDPTEADAAPSEDDGSAVLQTVGEVTITPDENTPATITVEAGGVAVTLAIETAVGETSIALAQSDVESLCDALAAAAAELDADAVTRGEAWLQQYREPKQ